MADDARDSEKLRRRVSSFLRALKRFALNPRSRTRQPKSLWWAIEANRARKYFTAARGQFIASLYNRPKKHSRTGRGFQADVPDWSGPPSDYREDLNTLRWLPSIVWPPQEGDRESIRPAIGQGRPTDCTCPSPGSVHCNNHHVSTARLELQAQLGDAFVFWGFDRMGEEVCKLWTEEEQMRFSELERLEATSECKTFWEAASKYLRTKSRRELISYYFNVFLLRRAMNQSRLAHGDVNTTSDEASGP